MGKHSIPLFSVVLKINMKLNKILPALLLLATTLSAQPASTTPIGQGCRTLSNPASFEAYGRPVLGRGVFFTWTTAEPPGYQTWISLGTFNPLYLTFNGCKVLSFPFAFIPVTNRAYTILIPNDRNLIGVNFYAQLLWNSPSHFGDLSRGFHLIIGDR